MAAELDDLKTAGVFSEDNWEICIMFGIIMTRSLLLLMMLMLIMLMLMMLMMMMLMMIQPMSPESGSQRGLP